MTRIIPALCLIICLFTSGCMFQPEDEKDLAKARQAFVTRQYFQAEDLYQRYLKVHPQGAKRWEVWNKLVEIARNVRENGKQAAEILEAMLLEYSGNPERSKEILTQLGTQYEQNRRWNKAIESWQRLLNTQPLTPLEEAKINRRLGKIYLRRTEYDLAIDSFQACTELNLSPEEHAHCLYDLAEAHAFLENFQLATEFLKEVLDIKGLDEKQRSVAVLLLADIYEQLEQYAEAIPLLESIQKTYPNPKVVETRLQYLRDKK